MAAEVSAATIRRIEQDTARMAAQSVARMDDELPWFRELPPDQRSWVTLVAQSGLQSFVAWLRSPDDVLRLTGEVFASAPRELARTVTLAADRRAGAADDRGGRGATCRCSPAPDEAAVVREELLRFSREIAFAAARVYASAAESRGSWDDRLEALVIDGWSAASRSAKRCPASSPRSAGARRPDLGARRRGPGRPVRRRARARCTR